jgi:chemotaxis protein MotB
MAMMASGGGSEGDLEAELNKGALWAVTYGDLMSYLMIFFLVLFSIYASGGKKSRTIESQALLAEMQKAFGGKIDPELFERIKNWKEEESLAFKLKDTPEAQSLSEFVQIQSGDEFIRLVLPEAISFDSGRAELHAQARPILGALAGLVKEIPNDIVVEGHTDSVPVRSREFANNFFLSASRAHSVMQALIQAGVPAARVSGQGYGESRPAADNGTAEGRAKNRRVEIVLVRGRN